jgi:hypothetical protein
VALAVTGVAAFLLPRDRLFDLNLPAFGDTKIVPAPAATQGFLELAVLPHS